MEEHKSLAEWIKEHKEELIVVGGICIGVGAVALIIRGKRGEMIEAVKILLEKLAKQPPIKAAETVEKVAVEITPEPI